MKRLALLLLALALALFPACGPAAPETTTVATTQAPTAATTQAPTTTEPETTTEAPFVPQSGESNGVNWRTLDLEDEANAAVREWLEKQINAARNEPKDEYKLSDSKTLFLKEKGKWSAKTIWLRDENSGKETLLIDIKDADGNYSEAYTAYIQTVLNERYFVYAAGIMDSDAGWGGMLFDTQRMKEIPITFPDDRYGYYKFAQDGVLYFGDEFYGPEQGQIHLYTLKLGEHWDASETLMASENLLKGIPEADMGETNYNMHDFSPNAQYVVVREEDSGGGTVALRIFDLQKKKFIARVSAGSGSIVFRDNNTFYCYDYTFDNIEAQTHRIPKRYALEITLP